MNEIVTAPSLPVAPGPEQILTLIEQCRCALACIESSHEARMIVDQTRAISYLAQKSRQSREVQNQAAEVALRAQREAGKVTAALEKKHPGRPTSSYLPDTMSGKYEALKDTGITPREASRWERVATLDDVTFEAYIADQQERDRELTTAGALAIAKEIDREQRRRAAATGSEHLSDSTKCRLICADVRDASQYLEPNSVDVIITDPPYNREAVPLYESLALLARHSLKDGGSLVVMTGQSYLPEVITAIAPHLSYYWTLAYLTPGGQSPRLWAKQVNSFWKPLLWFVKGSYDGNYLGDVAKSIVNDNDKRFHDWGQSESGMLDIVHRFTMPGQLVVDPFAGAGTTALACLAGERRFIGFDCDEQVLRIATRRVTEGAAA